MSTLKESIAVVGGPAEAAKICSVSIRAIYKWLSKDSLPRTEFTGETGYAEKLANASGGKFTATWLRENAKPDQKPDTEAA
jgi:hypothetical protein